MMMMMISCKRTHKGASSETKGRQYRQNISSQYNGMEVIETVWGKSGPMCEYMPWKLH